MADPTEVIIVLSPDTTKLALAASPFLAHINRENQVITWNIGVPGFYWPPEGGVVPLRENLPPGYSPWPPTAAMPALNERHQYVGDANNPLTDPNARLEKYKYDIFLLDSAGSTHVLSSSVHFAQFVAQFGADHVIEVDPDIENDPLP